PAARRPRPWGDRSCRDSRSTFRGTAGPSRWSSIRPDTRSACTPGRNCRPLRNDAAVARTMTPLIEIVGKHIASPEAVEQLARYPDLRPESDDFEPGEGSMPVHYLRSEGDGLLIKLSAEGEILALFLMSEGKDGFVQFRGELPAKLTFASQPPEVLKALG